MQVRARQVKEPVDRLYALFGITESTNAIYQKSIPIDYSPENSRELLEDICDVWQTRTLTGTKFTAAISG
jgi:hypothetical protein